MNNRIGGKGKVENSSTPKQTRRSIQNLLIEPFKQVRFGLYMLAITVVFLAITVLILVNSFLEQYQHVLSIFNVVDPKLRWEYLTDNVFYSSVWRLVICFVVFLLVLFSTILRLTHRFYGPIVAINRFIGELKKGHYSARLVLRKKDELKGIAAHLNQLAEILEQKSRKGG